jgi:hypothetical protein
MMHRRELLLGMLVTALGACTSRTGFQPTKVLVLATMHGAHERSINYRYEDVYARIAAFGPTALAVELRQEDLSPPAPYLASYYPAEMIELARRYASIARGIDWLGSTIEGRPIPDGYFANVDVKRLERALDADASMVDPKLDSLQSQRAAIIPEATASALNDGRYDVLNRHYYRALAAHLHGTKYQPISDFYAARDAHIAANAIALIRADRGGRVALVVGADHRSAVIDAIKPAFGIHINLIPV